jgi:hypothetical protein
MLLANQSDLNKTLLTHTITKNDREDPMQKMILQELANLKNQKSAPRSITTSEELTQRIQLQKLANEMELSQAEFKDKSEGRAFARDLAGQALTKIGESFATAYLESQRMAAMQASHPQSMGLTPPEQVTVEKASEPTLPKQTGETAAQPRVPEPEPEANEPDKYHVRGTPREDGSLSIPCPTCGSEMVAYPGDTKVECRTCGSSFNAGAKPEHEYTETPTQEATQEVDRQHTQEDTHEATQEVTQEPPSDNEPVEEPARRPKVIL